MSDLKTLLGDAYKEGMSVDEINAALAERELIDKSILDGYVSKATFDKTASEAAEYKKKWKATQTEAEQAALAEKERQEAIEAELNELRRTTKVSEFEKNYLKLGYDSETASKIAEATYDGDMETVFSLQGKFLENKQKAIKDEIMKNTPGAISGNQTEIDYTKQIQEAQAAGDFVTVSALLRQQASTSTQK